MGLLRIHCGSCGGTWEVYGRENWKNASCRTCPHCRAEIEAQDWKNQIIPAFGAMMDANKELMNTASGYSDPLFSVDYIEDNYYKNSFDKVKEAAENLQASVDALSETIDTLSNAIITTEIMKEGELLEKH